MKKMNRLINEALQSTKFRGHDMTRFKHGGYYDSAISFCKICGASVSVCTNPPPNGIDIMGNAVALNCPVLKEEDAWKT